MQGDLWHRSHAIFSPCGTYRYMLLRAWSVVLPRVCFVMLNPSTADHTTDDPTIRRCLGFAHAWGYGALQVVNLFAYRSTHPHNLHRTSDPIGPDNDAHILDAAVSVDCVILAWGVHGRWEKRDMAVIDLLCQSEVALFHLGLTKDQVPKHPLYLRADINPQPYGVIRSERSKGVAAVRLGRPVPTT